MKTAIERLFEAMMTDGWMTATDGDVEAPSGYFGYVTNVPTEVPQVRDAFRDVVDDVDDIPTIDLVGSFVVRTTSNGSTYVTRYDGPNAARRAYGELSCAYGYFLAGYGV